MMEKVIDITDIMQADGYDVVKAEAQGKEVKILWKLDSPIKTADKSLCHYQIECRGLSKPILTEEDAKKQNYVCVQGSDYSGLTSKEAKQAMKDGLFNQFIRV